MEQTTIETGLILPKNNRFAETEEILRMYTRSRASETLGLLGCGHSGACVYIVPDGIRFEQTMSFVGELYPWRTVKVNHKKTSGVLEFEKCKSVLRMYFFNVSQLNRYMGLEFSFAVAEGLLSWGKSSEEVQAMLYHVRNKLRAQNAPLSFDYTL